MFGLEILDVVIGLMFVYLLLSLLATAINEYISAVMNRRGKELARGIGRLLEDREAPDALRHAFKGLAPGMTPQTLTEQFYSHPLIRPLATRRGLIHSVPRLPSYIPARTFALALLDVLGYSEPSATDPAPAAGSKEASLIAIMKLLKRESPLDLSELKSMLEKANLPQDAILRIMEASTGAQSRLQHLHDGVEGWLLVIGIGIAFAMNADTIQMWRQLAADDELRTAMVERATSTLPTVDSIINRPADDTLTVEEARERYQTARSLVSEMDLQLGWSGENGWPARGWPTFYKIIGLLLTGIAISLGAPFWFDLLNKVISIRAAGRSPAEKPKSPEGPPKRAAEETPK
jgi:hypothetical protein